MLNSKQFTEAHNFFISYRDALKATEEIAERRESVKHYESQADQLVAATQKSQITADKQGVSAGANVADFYMVKAFEHSQALYKEYNFGSVQSRDDLVKRLDQALAEL